MNSTIKNPFKIGDLVNCTMDEPPKEMTVIEVDGKKIVGRYFDHYNKRIYETKGDFDLFERVYIKAIIL